MAKAKEINAVPEVKSTKVKTKCIGYSIPMGFEKKMVKDEETGKMVEKRFPVLKPMKCNAEFETTEYDGKISQRRCPICRTKNLAIRRVQSIQKQAELLANLATTQYKWDGDDLEMVCCAAESAIATATDKLRGQTAVNVNAFAL